MKKLLIQILSWSSVVAIFLYVLAGIVPAEQAAGASIWQRLGMAFDLLRGALAQANVTYVVVLVLSYMAYLLVLDTAGTRYVINRFNCRMSFGEMLPARAITFLIAALNYQAGQAALPIYLKRTKKVSLVKASGSIFFLAALDLFIVFVLGFLGALFVDDASLSRQVLIACCVGILGYIAHALLWHWKPAQNWFTRHFSKVDVFHAFREARLADYLKLLLLRSPIHLAIFVSLYLLIQCFNVHVPFNVILVYMPVIMVIGSIPIINVGSVGASQASVVYFFKAYAPEATLFTVALLWALAISALKVVVGAIFLTQHSSALFRPEPSPSHS